MSRKRHTPLRDESLSDGYCTLHVRRKLLGGAAFFEGLSEADLDRVSAQFRERNYPAGAVIFNEGAPATTLFFVAHGKVKLLRHGLEGNDVVLDMLTSGMLFGGAAVVGHRHYRETAIAQTPCCALTISGEGFEALLGQYPLMALKVLHSVADKLDDARETIRQLAQVPSESRIALTLLRLAERVGEPAAEGTLIQTPLSQQDIAAMVGATQETVSRTMAGFRRRGLIDSGRQWVLIRDESALQAIAGT